MSNTKKSADHIAGMIEAMKECANVARDNGRTARDAPSQADQDMFAERARGAAECEQYIRQTIEIYTGQTVPDEGGDA